MLGLLQHLAELVRPARDIRQRLRPGADVFVGIGEIGPLADHADWNRAGSPALADTPIEYGGLAPRV